MVSTQIPSSFTHVVQLPSDFCVCFCIRLNSTLHTPAVWTDAFHFTFVLTMIHIQNLNMQLHLKLFNLHAGQLRYLMSSSLGTTGETNQGLCWLHQVLINCVELFKLFFDLFTVNSWKYVNFPIKSNLQLGLNNFESNYTCEFRCFTVILSILEIALWRTGIVGQYQNICHKYRFINSVERGHDTRSLNAYHELDCLELSPPESR